MTTFKLSKTRQPNGLLSLTIGDPLVDEYLAWIADRKSENTRLSYGYDLVKFITWSEQQKTTGGPNSYLQLRPRHLLQFVNWLADPQGAPTQSTKKKHLSNNGYAAATIRRIIRAVTSFYDYLVLTEHLTTNPMPHRAMAEASVFAVPVRRQRHNSAATLAPRVPTTAPETLTADEIKDFMNSLHTQRDRTLFELLLVSGMRISEALNLRLTDINFAEQSVMVQPVPEEIEVRAVNNRGPKRDSSGIVSVHPTWFVHLNEYLTTEYPGNPDGFIFVVLKGPRRGQQLTYKGFYSIVAYHRSKADTPRVRLHRARHTFATKALQAGVRREVLKKQLRHTSDKSLDQYVWVDHQELLRELEKIQDDFI